MDEIKEGLEFGGHFATLTSKVISLWPARRRADAQSLPATGADAQSLEAIQAVLTDQVASHLESYPNDPVMLDALMAAGGRLNLDNLIRILQATAPQLNEDAKPDLITDDWGANFRDKARTCSDPEMAELWAQLLAGEANNPGFYSRKTVNILADMEPEDARLFKSLCDFRLVPVDPVSPLAVLKGSTTHMFERASVPPKLVVLDDTHPIYTDRGISFNSLARMEWLGLIRYVSFGYVTNHGNDKFAAYEHSGGQLYIASGKPIDFGRAEFLPGGAELSELCLPLESPDGFAEYLTGVWRSQNIRVAHTLAEALEG